MKKINVLITGKSGDVYNGVIQSIHSNLKSFNIFSTGSKNYSDGTHFIKSPNFHKDKKNYFQCLKNIINDFKIDLLIPTIDSEQAFIASKKFNCKVMVNKIIYIKKLSDKYLLIKFLKENNFPFINTKILNKKSLKKFKLPYIIKKRDGWGSKFNYIIKKKKPISFYENKLNNQYIIQEYIEGNDYTSSFYFYKKKIYTITFLRHLNKGSSIYVKKINNQSIENQIINIAKKTNLKFGNIQFKLKNNEVFLYEINPRLSGTLAVQYKFYNYVIFFINEKFKKNLKFFSKKNKNFTAYKKDSKWIEN